MGFIDFLGGGIVESIGKIADELITSDEEILEKKNEMKKIALNYKIKNKKLDFQMVNAQLEINKAEAKHSSIFVAGWRPAIGWIGAIALAYQFILYPLLIWAWTFLQSKNIIPSALAYPPILDVSALWTIVSGMLGVGVMRSFDKSRGRDTKRVQR